MCRTGVPSTLAGRYSRTKSCEHSDILEFPFERTVKQGFEQVFQPPGAGGLCGFKLAEFNYPLGKLSLDWQRRKWKFQRRQFRSVELSVDLHSCIPCEVTSGTQTIDE